MSKFLHLKKFYKISPNQDPAALGRANALSSTRFLLGAGEELTVPGPPLNLQHFAQCLAQNEHSINICWVNERMQGSRLTPFFLDSNPSKSLLQWLSALKRQPYCSNSFGVSKKNPISNPWSLNSNVTRSKFSDQSLCLVFLIYKIERALASLQGFCGIC